ncbi:1-deoxy-D-xylulose-5-phosphate synthase [Arthrobacter sp. Hiyo4]|nr:1-deoxy-D-xylulose-5-phosphate synthase [Arthrobacter sp. Hiyo4]
MAWEAINNIAADKRRRVVIVVNDNGRSYAPTVGGFADYLASLRPTIDSFRAALPMRARWTGGRRSSRTAAP